MTLQQAWNQHGVWGWAVLGVNSTCSEALALLPPPTSHPSSSQAYPQTSLLVSAVKEMNGGSNIIVASKIIRNSYG
jgi:hypothetical protein